MIKPADPNRTRTRPPARFEHGSSSGYHSPQVDADVKLNTNESPYPPPQMLLDRIADAVKDSALNRYPDLTAWKLREAIAELHGVGPENIYCGNGSDEVLLVLALAYGGVGSKTLVFEPTFSMHALSARLAGGDVIEGPRDAEFQIDPEDIRRLAPQANVTYLCSPNNPTGVAEARENLYVLLGSTEGVIVVDEAYGQFAEWTAEDELAEDVPLVVLHTFSKTWAMAGLRLGYAIGPKWLIANLWQTAPPYHLPSITQHAGVLALDFQDDMNRRVQLLVDERNRLQSAIDALGCKSWPSQANFILFRPTQPAESVWQTLVDHGVLIRDVSTWKGLANCLRVTVGTAEENDRFLTALQEAVQ